MSELNGTDTASVPDAPPRARHVLEEYRIRGFGYLYGRTGWLWLRYSVRGKDFRKPARTKDPREAYRQLRKLHGDAQSEKSVDPKAARVTVDQLLDALEADYRLKGVRSMASVLSHLKPIRAAFGDYRAVALTAEAVDSYIEARCTAGKRPATVNRETQLLGQAFRFWRQRNPAFTAAPWIRHLSELGNRREGFLEPDEAEPLASALPEDLADVTRFAYVSGWRKGAVTALRWTDVNRETGMIQLRPVMSRSAPTMTWKSKTSSGGRLPLGEGGILRELIERRWLQREYPMPDGTLALSDFVFHRNGRPIGDFRKAWASACKAVGRPAGRKVEGGLVPHDLRRSAVRNLVRAGTSKRVAMDVSGHKTRSVFDRYNITSERDLRAAIERTEDYVLERIDAPMNTPPPPPPVMLLALLVRAAQAQTRNWAGR